MSVVKDRFSQSSVRLPDLTSPVGPRSRSDLSIRGFFMGRAPSPRSSAECAKTSANSLCLTLHNIASTPHPSRIRGSRRLCFAPSNEKPPESSCFSEGTQSIHSKWAHPFSARSGYSRTKRKCTHPDPIRYRRPGSWFGRVHYFRRPTSRPSARRPA